MGCGLGGIADAHARFVEELGGVDARLGHDIHRASFERLHQGFRTGLGQARADDHGNGPLAHDLAQEGQAIHARQLDIEEHDIGHFLADALDGHIGIGRRRHDLEVGIGSDDLAQGRADRGAVVDDEHAYLAAGVSHGKNFQGFWNTAGAT